MDRGSKGKRSIYFYSLAALLTFWSCTLLDVGLRLFYQPVGTDLENEVTNPILDTLLQNLYAKNMLFLLIKMLQISQAKSLIRSISYEFALGIFRLSFLFVYLKCRNIKELMGRN